MIQSLFRKHPYTPLNKVLISKSAIRNNFEYFQSLNPHLDIFPVLKSNAYGHGITEVGKVVDEFKCKYICVDSIFEAYQLLNKGLETPILIMGYVNPENLKTKRLPFTYAVWDVKQIKKILEYQPKAKLHLFVDSGMHREGIRMDELDEFVAAILPYKVSIEGIMSHFASADDKSSTQTEEQLRNFKLAVNKFEESGLKFLYKHISATAGQLVVDNRELNSARIGIGLYGIGPINIDKNLKPALKLVSTIVQVKKIKMGETMGYNATFISEMDMIVGIVPLGYNDGFDRELSNKGVVKYKNEYCKILGRISMNLATIDLSSIDNPEVGDEILIFSNDLNDENSIQKISEFTKIPYEILVNINPTIKRVVVD